MTEAKLGQGQTSSARPPLRASAGIAVLGSRVVVHGEDLHHDCADLSYVQYLFFCVTGRRAEARQARVLERLWVSTGYPDARIWCNRIAGYLGSARVDPGLSMSACIAACDSVIYGFRALADGYRLQLEIPEASSEREAWLHAQMARRGLLYGYGRPLHGHDERVAVALKSLRDAGLRAGPQLARAFWLHRRLNEIKGIEINIAAVWAALAIDFGISLVEYEQFMLLMFAPGYSAVYGDQRARAPFGFLAGHQSWPSRAPESPGGLR